METRGKIQVLKLLAFSQGKMFRVSPLRTGGSRGEYHRWTSCSWILPCWGQSEGGKTSSTICDLAGAEAFTALSGMEGLSGSDGRAVYSRILSTAMSWFWASADWRMPNCTMPVNTNDWVMARPTVPAALSKKGNVEILVDLWTGRDWDRHSLDRVWRQINIW